MSDQIEDGAPNSGDDAAEAQFIAPERLIFFSDAVVAIAITLLALGLPLPANLTSGASNAQVFAGLRADHNDYLAFLISFVVIANYWRSHHRLFPNVARLDTSLVTLNFVWLLMIVLIPFATRLISADGGFAVRFAVYAGIQVVTMITFLLMSRHIRTGKLLRPGSPPPATAADDTALIALAGMFAISIPAAFVVNDWAFLFWIFSPVAAKVARRLRTRHSR
jgi:uncharacterized membrane protein